MNDNDHHAMMNGPRIAQSLPDEYMKALIKAASNTPPLYRTEYQSADGKLVEVKTTSLFVWAAIDTKTGKVYVDDIKEFDDELDALSSGYEWRKFRLVPEGAE